MMFNLLTREDQGFFDFSMGLNNILMSISSVSVLLLTEIKKVLFQ